MARKNGAHASLFEEVVGRLDYCRLLGARFGLLSGFTPRILTTFGVLLLIMTSQVD